MNEVTEATIILGPTSDNNDRLHELGHIEQALLEPKEFRKQAKDAANAGTDEEYKAGESEKYADGFAKKARKKISIQPPPD